MPETEIGPLFDGGTGGADAVVVAGAGAAAGVTLVDDGLGVETGASSVPDVGMPAA
jgi:hypothetical protein